jgi:hypothetical protein
MAASNSLSWLLEEDPVNPGVRYFALRDLLNRDENDGEVVAARHAVMRSGPVPVILAAQTQDGSWPAGEKGSRLRYQATSNQVRFLADLGADPMDERVRLAGKYVLEHHIASNGAFAVSQPPVPSTAVHCLNGQLIYALSRLGFGDDARLQEALHWQALAITGDPPGVRYYKSTTAGPGFACGVNLGQPCAWGAVKAMKALQTVPPGERSALIDHAIQVGAEFLLSRDPASAEYPYTERVSSSWFKFIFPMSYWADVLEIAEVLATLGLLPDPRMDRLIKLIQSKQDDQGRWKMENSLNGKMWIDIETPGKPSKWITLRAMRVLKGLS